MVGKLKMTNYNYIPLEIQEEIMKRLPVESLIRFRLVSKPWKSLIHSSRLIADYRVQRHRLLVVSYDTEDKKPKWVSIADDDTFPQQKLDLTLPMSLNGQQRMLIGSSHGLLGFLYKNLVVIWNPTIRKSVSIDVPNVFDFPSKTMYGFGVCPVTYDPKLVRMIFNSKLVETYSVEVLTLSSGVWRSPHGNLPRKSIRITHPHVNVDGCIYLEAHEYIHLPDGSFKHSKLIIAFATTNEEFTEIRYPDSIALKDDNKIRICKLRESLVVVDLNSRNQAYGVWIMMNHGDPKSFTKLHNINLPDASLRYIFAFTTSGEAIVNIHNDAVDALYVYEPNSKKISFGISRSFYLSCYTETLLLLDH